MTGAAEARTGEGNRRLTVVSLIDRLIVWSSAIVAVMSTIALFFSISSEVISRYVTGRSLGWTSEMPNLLFPWMTMAGIVLAAQFGRHIVVELGVRLLPENAARLMLILIQIPVATMFAYLTWTGLSILEVTAAQRFPATRIASNWAYLSFVVGFALLTVTAITTAVKLWMIHEDPFTLRDDAGLGGTE